MSAHAAQKQHFLVDKKPYFKHFYPKDLAFTAVRSVAIQGLLVVNGYLASLDFDESDEEREFMLSSGEEEEEETDQQIVMKSDYEFPSQEEFANSCIRSFLKSISVTTCLRTLEEVVIRTCRPTLVRKLIKDVSKSATRKFARTGNYWITASSMVRTGMRSNALTHLAIFLVEETHQLILIVCRYFYRSSRSKSKKSLKGSQGETKNDEEDEEQGTSDALYFLERTAKNAARSGLSIVTGGVGAAIGTYFRPGLGTIIGATLGDTVAYAL